MPVSSALQSFPGAQVSPRGTGTLFILALLCGPAVSAPLAEARGESFVVSLTDERCKLAVVTNLPGRATWTEKGRTFEGCYGVSHSVVAFYFEDRTVVMLPREAFSRVRQI
jgi:hypothetical protein